MWLLSTERAELHYFNEPGDVPGGYAILSHVWGENEQSFQGTQELRISCANSAIDLASRNVFGPVMSSNPRDHSSPKVRQSCIVAERYGYKWIWNDTCCIDKTSSTELTEAINTMFRYYELSQMCFAYLADVSSASSADPTNREFCTSRWHERGWTLQELIAPESVVFLSREWEYFGNKHDLASVLESVTHVPSSLLKGEEDIDRFSVAQRMSWAIGRKTTRLEDRGYSLLGIFGITMTVLYGEGNRAFGRFQEKLAKRSTDTSLLSWGLRLSWKSLCTVASSEPQNHAHHLPERYLLSPSPDYFHPTRATSYTLSCASFLQAVNQQNSHDQRGVEQSLMPHKFPRPAIPTYTITQYGVECRIPIFDAPNFSVALLFCSDKDGYVGLILTPCPDSDDVNEPLYHTGVTFNGAGGQFRTVRIVNLGKDLTALRFAGSPVSFAWKEIFLALRPPLSSRKLSRMMGPSAAFKISAELLNMLMLHGFERYPTQIPRSWTQSHSIDVMFQCVGPSGSRVLLALGRCSRHTPTSTCGSSGPSQHWAAFWIIPYQASESEYPPPHDCLEHHICEWPNSRKLFDEEYGGYSLPMVVSFSPLPNDSNSIIFSSVRFGRRSRHGESWFAHSTVQSD